MPLVKERGAHPKVRLLDLLERMAQVDETTIGRRFKYANGAASSDSTWGGMSTSSKRAASTSTCPIATETTNGELSATMIMGGEVPEVH
jgi:hypothetical protein